MHSSTTVLERTTTARMARCLFALSRWWSGKTEGIRRGHRVGRSSSVLLEQGYEATSVRHLMAQTGITAASLYNAFGEKRALYQKALDHYVEASVADRIRRCEALPPRQAIEAFVEDIVKRSLNNRDRRVHAGERGARCGAASGVSADRY